MTDFQSENILPLVEKIALSSEFSGGKRLSQLLRYVVEKKLSNQEDHLKQYTIAVEALGYPDSYDPQSNPSVRILAKRLRRALGFYYATEGRHDPIQIDIPKGSYIPIFNKNYSVSEPSRSDATSSTAPEQTFSHTSNPTIAVVMFENLDNDNNTTLFAKGLTAQILVSLSHFSELSVMGPFNLAGDQTTNYYSFMHDHGAMFVLQGGVRYHGKMVRITIELTDSIKSSKLWAKTFDYNIDKTSLFEIEDEVTSSVTGAIADDLGIIFRKLQSHEYRKHITISDITWAVLTYNYAWITHAPHDWENANKAVNKTLKNHPDNALLIALKSNIYYADTLHELNIVPDSREKMEGLALKAVALDPNLQQAQYNLVVQNAFWNRPEKCVEAAAKTIRLNPNNARLLAGSAFATTSVGAYEIGLEYIEKARRLNPHYPGYYHLVEFLVFLSNEEYEKAWDEVRKIHLEGMLWHSLFRAAVLGYLGRPNVAEPYIEDLLRVKPEFPERPKDYIRRFFITDTHVKMIMDGLRKAGMEMD